MSWLLDHLQNALVFALVALVAVMLYPVYRIPGHPLVSIVLFLLVVFLGTRALWRAP